MEIKLSECGLATTHMGVVIEDRYRVPEYSLIQC